MEGPQEIPEASTILPSNDNKTISMATEIEQLTSNFKGQCKVMEATGKFPKVVKLHPENLDIVFNFKLTGKQIGIFLN